MPTSRKRQVIAQTTPFSEKVHDALVLLAEGSSLEEAANAVGYRTDSLKTQMYAVASKWNLAYDQGYVVAAVTEEARNRGMFNEIMFTHHNESDNCFCDFCHAAFGHDPTARYA